MKTLMFMRHAKASWPDAGVDDHDRTLNKRGRAASVEMAAKILAKYKAPDCIVSSTAKRAVETAKIVADEISYDGPIELRRRLYMAEPETILDVVSELSPELKRVLVIGHNPGLSELSSQLAEEAIQMPTASIFVVEAKIEEFAELSLKKLKKTKLLQPTKSTKK